MGNTNRAIYIYDVITCVFNMEDMGIMPALRRLIAKKIYDIRVEVGIEGDEAHDWYLAGEFLSVWDKKELFNDVKFYNWCMERIGRG